MIQRTFILLRRSEIKFKDSQRRPSKFNDLLLHSWKKDKSEDNQLPIFGNATEDAAVRGRKKLKREGLFSVVVHKRTQKGRESGFHLYNSIELLPQSMEAEDAEFGHLGSKDLYGSNSGLHSSSWSSVKSVDEGCFSSLVAGRPNYPQRAGFVEADVQVKDKADAQIKDKLNCSSAAGNLLKEKGKKEDFYKPDDFTLGDIVWG